MMLTCIWGKLQMNESKSCLLGNVQNTVYAFGWLHGRVTDGCVWKQSFEGQIFLTVSSLTLPLSLEVTKSGFWNDTLSFIPILPAYSHLFLHERSETRFNSLIIRGGNCTSYFRGKLIPWY